jgi:hypothetical protein
MSWVGWRGALPGASPRASYAACCAADWLRAAGARDGQVGGAVALPDIEDQKEKDLVDGDSCM